MSQGGGGAELIYVFASDGTYKHAGVLMQERASGTASFQRGLRGTVEVAGAELVLRPDEGTEALHDPDVPSADFDRPIKNLAPERYSWALAGSGAERQLTLTDAQGRTIRYAPE